MYLPYFLRSASVAHDLEISSICRFAFIASQNLQLLEKHREEEKNKLALKIKRENENFMKDIEQGRQERLKFLIKQTEIFAHFLIGGKAEDNSKKKKSEMRKANNF